VTRFAGVAGLAAALAVLSRFTGVATFSGAAFLFPRTDGTVKTNLLRSRSINKIIN